MSIRVLFNKEKDACFNCYRVPRTTELIIEIEAGSMITRFCLCAKCVKQMHVSVKVAELHIETGNPELI